MIKQLFYNMTDNEKSVLKSDMLTQISFFQHERLIHLIVTAAISMLAVLSLFGSLAPSIYNKVNIYFDNGIKTRIMLKNIEPEDISFTFGDRVEIPRFYLKRNSHYIFAYIDKG